jgi:uncharacterized protein YdiU (UPF0061 family)
MTQTSPEERMSTATVPAAERDVVGWRLEDTYARLPAALSSPATPAAVRAPRTLILNHRLAGELGLDLGRLSPDDAAAVFAGQRLPPGSRPIAQAYAGHQFGHFTMLGDGRAILLGEQRTPAGRLVDVQLKGPGRTRFSRGGDGRAAVGPMLREYVVSEAMAALGVPTTRSLAVVATGETVYRTTPLPGAVLTRTAASHIRVGTFEYAAALGDDAVLRALADYAIARHDPDLVGRPDRYAAFLRAVADRQAALIARWQLVGFVHGVMNTDNMAVSGETIDYGPCAFMNAYDPATVFSSIDTAGRYAYGNQPAIARWNLARFAEALLTLIDPDQEKAIAAATEVLEAFPDRFAGYWLAGMRRKLGLQTDEAGDRELADALLDWMRRTRADWTNAFRDLADGTLTAGAYQDPDFQAWHARWRDRLARDDRPAESAHALMRGVNPAVIPRNHRVEEALAAAEGREDLAPLHALLAAVTSPYDAGAAVAYREAPADECGYRTFCGT